MYEESQDIAAHHKERAGDAAATPERGLDLVIHGANYVGYIVLDSIVEGCSAGGLRITEDLALDEVRELAHEMSFKYSLFDLPRGGAKAGIRIAKDLDRDARLAALEDFGRRLSPVVHNGLYYPGMDMNCGPDELRAVYRGIGMELGEITDTSWFTAISVQHALEACADRLAPSGDTLTLAIEGFGSVATYLAERLDPKRFRILCVSTIEGACQLDGTLAPAELAERRKAVGDRFVLDLPGDSIAREAVLIADVDILLPSSRTWVIHPELARQMHAKAVVPIANAPYSGGAVEILHERGIVCLPGYLSNVGGVLASGLYDQGLPIEAVERLFASEYRAVVDAILPAAVSRGLPVTESVEAIATRRMPARLAGTQRSIAGRVYSRFVFPRMPHWWRRRSAEQRFVQSARVLRQEIAAWERES